MPWSFALDPRNQLCNDTSYCNPAAGPSVGVPIFSFVFVLCMCGGDSSSPSRRKWVVIGLDHA